MDEQAWDDVAATFEEDIFSVPKHDRKQKILQRVQRHAGKKRTAADIGCGIGRTVPMLAEHFASVFATDLSSECLTVAENKNARYHNVEYLHADLAKPLPFPPVDFALCINVLLIASRAKRQAMMDNICAVVKPGGHLLLVTPSLESALYASHRLVQLNELKGMKPAVAQRKAARDTTKLDMGIVVVNGAPTKHHLKEELADLLTQHGMKVLELQKIEYPWAYVLEDAPADMPAPMPWNWMAVAERVA
ncbi:MAG: methyltransferase domain-containing protein [Flavobacteriales bacterium]|jgi:ubiquinone/menaquinone biosynthesis C-methylase UbiE|nr:methyltransferase domain-containing protein [Flavobacteriales bacterium]MBK6894859.1 methyltransferase domain-containing protein [Flavobacteriales bacterium]MBK7285900.1 methyltransferase domain-containing protein [Flavobacteriales bacterium]MBK9058419.1 methyltransferase domain-containing protein [Flavobacteriales bacterium]MBK9599635.1 methyltransferase domain-containing protein [Flavobacteriales bacterium]